LLLKDECESIQCMLGAESSSRTSDTFRQRYEQQARIDSLWDGWTLYGPDAGACTVLEEER